MREMRVKVFCTISVLMLCALSTISRADGKSCIDFASLAKDTYPLPFETNQVRFNGIVDDDVSVQEEEVVTMGNSVEHLKVLDYGRGITIRPPENTDPSKDISYVLVRFVSHNAAPITLSAIDGWGNITDVRDASGSPEGYLRSLSVSRRELDLERRKFKPITAVRLSLNPEVKLVEVCWAYHER